MNTRSMSPLTPQQTSSTDKELAHVTEKEAVPCDSAHFCRQCNANWCGTRQANTSLENASNGIVHEPTLRERCKTHVRRHPWWYRILLCAVLVVVAIVIALAVVFRPKHHHPIIVPKRVATGIYPNGTGLVVLDRGDESDTVDIFFIHASGQIRRSVFDDGTIQWTNGRPEDSVLSTDAPLPRPGSPLMAASYKIGNETTWRIFYIDSDDFLQESIGSVSGSEFPVSTDWFTGPLGSGRFKANSSPHTGLSVCKQNLWSTDPYGFNNGTLVLFYGGDDGMNHMLTHETQQTLWNFNRTFQDSLAASGIECTDRGDEITDVWMISSAGQLSQTSFNFDPKSDNSVYRAGEWTPPGVIYEGAVRDPTSISAIKYTGNSSTYKSGSTFIHFIATDDTIQGVNVDTSNRSYVPGLTEYFWNVSSSTIVDGSKIASVALPTYNTNGQRLGEDVKVFAQFMSNVTQISMMSRNFDSGAVSFAMRVGDVSNIQD